MADWIRSDFKWNGDKVLAAIEKKDAALTRIGMVIQEAAKKLVKVDTGNLKGSINYALADEASPGGSKTSGEMVEEAGLLTPHGVKDEVWIGTNVKYARRIEFGFRGIDKLGRKYNQAPQPYLTPAYEKQKDRITRIIKDILGPQIKGAG
jgi:phage gpG-like protein